MFEKYYDHRELAKLLLSKEEFKPFPKYEDRDGWAKVCPEIKNCLFNDKMKERILNYQTSALTATAYLEFYRSGGNHESWSHIVHGRRDLLWDAILAECVEGKGEFIDKIIDVAWAICEETTWVMPAHNNHMHNHMWTGVMKNALPDPTEKNFICIYSAICGSVLAWTYYFLKDRLDKESPLICKMIEVALRDHIITPFMTHDDLTWFGFYGHKINNWNPWIIESIIPVGLFILQGDERLEFMARALEKFDIYVNYTKADGASDEGPGYWFHGGNNMLDVFEMIKDTTGGKINMLDTEFARNVGEYIPHANMCDNMYANFADSGINLSYGYLLYRHAVNTKSEYLMNYALSKPTTKNLPDTSINATYGALKAIFNYQDVLSEKETSFKHRDVWLKDTQLLFVRTNDETVSLAAKGGYNNESHNHNDLGNFIYMLNGEAAIADLGGAEYTARTFSPYRYCYWILQSTAHNCAMINGFQQHDGDNFTAKEVSHSLTDDRVQVKLDLRHAYEEEANIHFYTREFDFDKNTGALVVTDDITLEEASDNVDVHFATTRDIEIEGSTVKFLMKDGKKVSLTVENADISVEYHYNINKEYEHYFKYDNSDGCAPAKRIVFKMKQNTAHHIIKTTIVHD